MKTRILPTVLILTFFMALTSCIFQPTTSLIGIGLIPYPPKSNVSFKVTSDQSPDPLYASVIEANTRYNPPGYLYTAVLPLNSKITVKVDVGEGSLMKTKTAVFKLFEPYPGSFVAIVDLTDGVFNITCRATGVITPCEQP